MNNDNITDIILSYKSIHKVLYNMDYHQKTKFDGDYSKYEFLKDISLCVVDFAKDEVYLHQLCFTTESNHANGSGIEYNDLYKDKSIFLDSCVLNHFIGKTFTGNDFDDVIAQINNEIQKLLKMPEEVFVKWKLENK